jgi:hypothetical protein
MTAMQGLGDCFIRQAVGTTNPLFFPYPVYSFKFTPEETYQDLSAYRGGSRGVEETYSSEFKDKLTLVTQISNWNLFGLSRDQVKKTFTSFKMPEIKRIVVPATGIINDAGVTATNLTTFSAAVEGRGAWGNAGNLAVVTAAPVGRQVQAAAGTITVPTALAGATITYSFDKTYTSGEGFGGPGTGAAGLGEMEFHGKIVDTTSGINGYHIWFPKLKRTSPKSEISFDGTAMTISIEYSAYRPGGWDDCYQAIDLTTAI